MKGNPVTFLDLLGLMLLGLKLADLTYLPWWVILAPLYIPWSVAFVAAFVVAYAKEKAKRREAVN